MLPWSINYLHNPVLSLSCRYDIFCSLKVKYFLQKNTFSSTRKSKNIYLKKKLKFTWFWFLNFSPLESLLCVSSLCQHLRHLVTQSQCISHQRSDAKMTQNYSTVMQNVGERSKNDAKIMQNDIKCCKYDAESMRKSPKIWRKNDANMTKKLNYILFSLVKNPQKTFYKLANFSYL